jgi:O-antigen ligase
MNYVFPAAFLANTFAVTAMMIVLGLAGQSDAAADFGIVHGATVALLHSFSGNARSIILNSASPISMGAVLRARLLLILPLGALSWLLSAHIASVEALLALMLVLRRCAEWIAEVRISALELRNDRRPAARFTVLQTLLFLTTAGWLLADLPFREAMLFVWASSPLWSCSHFLREQLRAGGRGMLRLLPHFGATAVIGISVYVFRLLILLLVGKTFAGDLFTAFAIGGLLGSVFAQAVGPTLALHEARGMPQPRWLGVALGLATVTGLAFCAAAMLETGLSAASGKSDAFWLATGCSLIGGVIMVLAQQIRLRMLQQHSDKDVFGPEVLINILIVAAVPYIFFLAGKDALAFLYLFNSALALVFYWSAQRSAELWHGKMRGLLMPLKQLIAAMLILPLFFRLNGSIFRDASYNYDTAGALMLLPIPFSVFACYGGILLLGGYARAKLSLTVIFATFALMLVSSVMLAQGQSSQEQAKLILLIQFVLPMFALVLGQLHGDGFTKQPALAQTFFYVLSILVPIQLLATWLQGKIVISPHLYLFSIYQHLQYVPSIFVATYLLTLCSLWHSPEYRRPLALLGLTMGIYAAATVSTLAVGILVMGIAGFALYNWLNGPDRRELAVMALLVATLAACYFAFASGKTIFADKYSLGGIDSDRSLSAPLNVRERIDYWNFYGRAIGEHPYAAAMGHAAPPDRVKNPSAHNYYLDFAYNFGLIALLPLAVLLAITLAALWKQRRKILRSPPLLGLTAAVLFLVLLDNSLKVGMRQPYPGIFTFFLWGVLLSNLLPTAPARSDDAA